MNAVPPLLNWGALPTRNKRTARKHPAGPTRPKLVAKPNNPWQKEDIADTSAIGRIEPNPAGGSRRRWYRSRCDRRFWSGGPTVGWLPELPSPSTSAVPRRDLLAMLTLPKELLSPPGRNQRSQRVRGHEGRQTPRGFSTIRPIADESSISSFSLASSSS